MSASASARSGGWLACLVLEMPSIDGEPYILGVDERAGGPVDAVWSSIVEFFGVRFGGEPAGVLASREMPGASWFPGATVNFAEHVFRGKDDDALAIQHASELRELSSWDWGRLRAETGQIAAGLRALGVGEGDRVAAYMPN